ncbi:unnamed protein product [Owenia fusiformis]|uniref:Uncharacterized protein n=1 Tax=Owenia fusiformis TaxID=6347 RepID=A0A8J1XKJ3_OWEFU|nr:unnamed protein product [Owenia fusiformis]
MSDFDDRSGIVCCKTDWGRWWQTMDEVVVEVDVPEGTNAKNIKCEIKTKLVKLSLQGNVIFEGELPAAVNSEESLWTLEDRKLVRICLEKCDRSAENCWKTLLLGECTPDAWTLDQMQRKLTLQRFQYENPGMDFSNAEVSGNYASGGPKFPS